MLYTALLGVIVGALIIGAPLGFVIGNLWARNDRRRFQLPPHRGKATWGEIRTEPSAGVTWRTK